MNFVDDQLEVRWRSYVHQKRAAFDAVRLLLGAVLSTWRSRTATALTNNVLHPCWLSRAHLNAVSSAYLAVLVFQLAGRSMYVRHKGSLSMALKFLLHLPPLLWLPYSMVQCSGGGIMAGVPHLMQPRDTYLVAAAATSATGGDMACMPAAAAGAAGHALLYNASIIAGTGTATTAASAADGAAAAAATASAVVSAIGDCSAGSGAGGLGSGPLASVGAETHSAASALRLLACTGQWLEPLLSGVLLPLSLTSSGHVWFKTIYSMLFLPTIPVTVRVLDCDPLHHALFVALQQRTAALLAKLGGAAGAAAAHRITCVSAAVGIIGAGHLLLAWLLPVVLVVMQERAERCRAVQDHELHLPGYPAQPSAAADGRDAMQYWHVVYACVVVMRVLCDFAALQRMSALYLAIAERMWLAQSPVWNACIQAAGSAQGAAADSLVQQQ